MGGQRLAKRFRGRRGLVAGGSMTRIWAPIGFLMQVHHRQKILERINEAAEGWVVRRWNSRRTEGLVCAFFRRSDEPGTIAPTEQGRPEHDEEQNPPQCAQR